MTQCLCARGLALLVVLFLLPGCTSSNLLTTLPADFDIARAPGAGVIVGSVGAKSDAWHEWSHYTLQAVSNPEKQWVVSSASTHNPFYMFGSMPLCTDDGLPEECGHLFALVLPAGDYEIKYVVPAMDSYIAIGSGQAYWRHQLTGYRFQVSPGRVTYVGNLLSRICISRARKSGGDSRVWAAVGDVTDRSSRDIPLLLQKYPQLATATLVNEPMPGEPWLWRFEPDHWFDLNEEPPYGWPADCSLEPEVLQRYLHGN